MARLESMPRPPSWLVAARPHTLLTDPQVGGIMQTATATLQQTAPAPGTKLADFTLKLATKDSYTTDFKLSDHLGKGPIVFAFFPAAFTGICTKEVCDMRDSMASLGALNAQVFGFSTDKAPSNMMFIQKEGLPFTIVSDPNKEFIGKVWPAYQNAIVGAVGVAKRGAMIVNPDGTVKWAFASDDVKVWVGADEIRKHLA
jgi:glutaredoxin-dependent peroxiredoxin